MNRELVLYLDNEYELVYAEELCKDLKVDVEVTAWVDAKNNKIYKQEPKFKSNYQIEVKFNGEECYVDYLVYLLSLRLDQVTYLRKCIQVNEEPPEEVKLLEDKKDFKGMGYPFPNMDIFSLDDLI